MKLLFFGPKLDIRVLKTNHDVNDFLLDLREKLNTFKEDNHSTYQPHVTTKNLNEVQMPFFSYVLVDGGEIVKEWILK